MSNNWLYEVFRLLDDFLLEIERPRFSLRNLTTEIIGMALETSYTLINRHNVLSLLTPGGLQGFCSSLHFLLLRLIGGTRSLMDGRNSNILLCRKKNEGYLESKNFRCPIKILADVLFQW